MPYETDERIKRSLNRGPQHIFRQANVTTTGHRSTGSNVRRLGCRRGLATAFGDRTFDVLASPEAAPRWSATAAVERNPQQIVRHPLAHVAYTDRQIFAYFAYGMVGACWHRSRWRCACRHVWPCAGGHVWPCACESCVSWQTRCLSWEPTKWLSRHLATWGRLCRLLARTQC